MPPRYYSQSYDPVDDDLSNARSNINLNEYTGYDRPVTPEVRDTHDFDDHYQQQPSSYSRYAPEDIAYEPSRQPRDVEESYHSPPRAAHHHQPQSSFDRAMGQDVHAPDPQYEDFDTLKQRPAKKALGAGGWWAGGMNWWHRQTRKMKYIILGGIAGVILLLIIIIAVAASLAGGDDFNYVPRFNQVTNETSFTTGGATRADPLKSLNDGIGAGKDVYKYYEGPAANFPTEDGWVSFEDMWKANKPIMRKSCGWLEEGPDNSPEIIDDIYDAIQNRSAASLVDHRYILAIVMQESKGCVQVGHTVSSGGTRNPGLMQSHNGHAYNSDHSQMSILQMIQDGTQGTEHGDGLVQNLDLYGDPFTAARGYNSGFIPESGDLSDEAGATACYVSDVANRLTGWVNAKTKCPEDM